MSDLTRVVCADCKKKQKESFRRMGGQEILAKIAKELDKHELYCQLGFETGSGYDSTIEHMWVEIEKITLVDDKIEVIEGVLSNEPTRECAFKCGSYLSFTVDEVENMMLDNRLFF